MSEGAVHKTVQRGVDVGRLLATVQEGDDMPPGPFSDGVSTALEQMPSQLSSYT